MPVKDLALDTELDVAQFGIVDELWIDPGAAGQRRAVPNGPDGLPAEAGAKNVGQQQTRPLLLKASQAQREIRDNVTGQWQLAERPRLGMAQAHLAVAEDIE
jgi:hypothetical protein